MAQAEPILSPEQQALLALRQLRRKVEALERDRREPIAIVGVDCRFPGDAVDPASYWRMLQERQNAVSEIPASRFETADIYDANPETPGKTYCRSAGMLRDVEWFDADFFGISPREAICMDPQQRLLLEVAWHALESGGIDPKSLAGSNTGVFIGLTTNEYSQLYARTVRPCDVSSYVIQGSALNAAAGRISYFLGLHGPSLAIDTACSSSLVAIDRACRSLREGECGLAIVGAANVLAIPESLIAASRAGMLAGDGRVKAFDGGADGFVRGEGCGVVVLKRFRDAEAAGDRVWGVIRGSAVNQDGPSSGLTVPNGLAQQALLRQALENAGVRAEQVGYVEAHGTGTALGDPIEAEAIGQVYGAGRKESEPLWIGSVKTNLGHLEAAAGMAGLIKVVLGLAEGEIPAQLHWRAPSPHIRWSELAVRVVSESRAWRKIGGRRIAGVSSFGFSGTNAHVIVEEAPARRQKRERSIRERRERSIEVLTITGRTPRARQRLAQEYAAQLEQEGGASWGDICHTANVGRAHWGQRVSVQARSKREAAEKLRAYGRGEKAAGVVEGSVAAGAAPAVEFVYPGRGLPEAAVAELRASSSVFAEAWERSEDSEAAVAELWKSWGVAAQRRGGERSTTIRLEMAAPAKEVWEWLAAEVQRLDAAGVEVDWKGWDTGYERQRVSVPLYPFERQRYWVEKKKAPEEAAYPLLGKRLRSALEAEQYETELQGGAGWVEEHRVGGRAVLPAAGLLEMLLETGCREWRDFVIVEPLEWASAEERPTVQVVLDAKVDAAVAGPGRRARIFSWAEAGEGQWRLHAEAWSDDSGFEQRAELSLSEAQARCGRERDRAEFYAGLAERGLEFGAQFQGLRRVWSGEGEALGEVKVSVPPGAAWVLYPPLLDACLQVAGALAEPDTVAANSLYLPFGIEHFQLTDPNEFSTKLIHRPPWRGHSCLPCRDSSRHSLLETETVFSHVRLTSLAPDHLACDLTIFDSRGTVLASLRRLQFRGVKKAAIRSGSLYATTWVEIDLLAKQAVKTPGACLILADQQGIGERLAKRLADRGISSRLVLADHPDELNFESRIDCIVHLWGLDAPDFAHIGHEPLAALQEKGYGSAVRLFQALLKTERSSFPRTLLVTRGTNAVHGSAEVQSSTGAALWALRRTVALEHPELQCSSLDLDISDSRDDVDAILSALSQSEEPELAVRGSRFYAPRLSPVTPIVVHERQLRDELVPHESGLIDDLICRPAARQAPGSEEVEIQVRATGLNFRDLLHVLNAMPQTKRAIGGECAGIIARAGDRSGFVQGEEVLAFSPGWFSSYATVPAHFVTRKPNDLTFEQAAGLPIAYLTALFGLRRLANIQHGQSILIHSASGGLGLAAVHVARAAGATIYATAGSEKKRGFLQSMGVEHVLDSRSLGFSDEVRQLTGGEGVDIVLNSLSGEYIRKSLVVVREGGCFLEVGKRGILPPEEVAQLRPDIRYFAFDLGTEAMRDRNVAPSLFDELLLALRDHSLPPLPVTEVAFEKAANAFRIMQNAQHIGKIVVSYPIGNSSEETGLRVRSDGCYLITGGLGALGLQTASWLIARGARNVTLMSRTAPALAVTQRVEELRANGVHIRIACADCADRERTADVISSMKAEAPLRGVIHAAGVLDDQVFEKQSRRSFAHVARSKIDGAWTLHELTAQAPLDFFIIYSSAAAVLGSAGQANYAAANAAADAIAHVRKGLGLKALSINWGAWAGDGMLSTIAAKRRDAGFRRMSGSEGFAAIDALTNASITQACVLPGQNWPLYLNDRHAGKNEPFFTLFQANTTIAEHREGTPTFLALLTAEAPAGQPGLMLEFVKAQAAHILGFGPGYSIDELTPLHEIGLDSLLSVELRNSLCKSLGCALPSTLVFDHPTAGELSAYLLVQIIPNWAPKDSYESVESRRSIEALSDEAAEALLLEELDFPNHAYRS